MNKEIKVESKEKNEKDISLIGSCPVEAHTKILVGDGPLNAFAIQAKDSIIAYAERYSDSIKIVRWSQTSGIVSSLSKLAGNWRFFLTQVSTDISIQSLTFSPDGNFLAALGDLPEHQISVWDWKAQKMIVSCPNGCPAKSISFNPMDSRQLCSSGKENIIKFWKIKAGFKKYTLSHVKGSSSPHTIEKKEKYHIDLNPWQLEVGFDAKDNFEPADPKDHCWIPDRHVFSVSNSGLQLFKYSAETGAFEVFIDIGKDAGYKIASAQQNIRHIFLGCTDGSVHVYNLQGDFLRSHKLPEEGSIKNMEFSPDYQRILVETNDQKIYLCDLKKLQSIRIKLDNVTNLSKSVSLHSERCLMTVDLSGMATFWQAEKNTEIQKISFSFQVSAVASHPILPIVAVGSSSGVLRLYNAKEISYKNPILIFRKRIHKSAIQKLAIDFRGKLLATASNDGLIFLYDLEKMVPLGYLPFEGVLRTIRWEVCDNAGKEAYRLYLLQGNNGMETTSLLAFDFQEKDKIVTVEENNFEIARSGPRISHLFTFDGHITDFMVAPKYICTLT